MMKNEKTPDYSFKIRHLTKNEGGGYLIEYPELPGCMSDGETIEETIQNGQDAVKCWIDAAHKSGRAIPQPGTFENLSGKWVQRVPKSIHLQLVEKAEEEGVSLNTLVISLLAAALSKGQQPSKRV